MANYIFSLCPILQWSQCIYHVHMHNITFPCPSKIGLSDFLFFFQSEHIHFRGMAFSPLARIKLDISIFLLCIFPLHICLFARQASCPICLKLDFLIFFNRASLPCTYAFYAVGIFSVFLKLDISIFQSCIFPLHVCLFTRQAYFQSVSNWTFRFFNRAFFPYALMPFSRQASFSVRLKSDFFFLFYRALLMIYAHLTRQAFSSACLKLNISIFLKCAPPCTYAFFAVGIFFCPSQIGLFYFFFVHS